MSPPDSFTAGPGASPPGPDPLDPLWERGVSRDVAEARGYMPVYGRKHPKHDPESVRAAYAPFNLTPGQKATRMRQAGDLVDEHGTKGCGDGLLMPKFAVPDFDPIEPQLRPRYALLRGEKWHR